MLYENMFCVGVLRREIAKEISTNQHKANKLWYRKNNKTFRIIF